MQHLRFIYNFMQNQSFLETEAAVKRKMSQYLESPFQNPTL